MRALDLLRFCVSAWAHYKEYCRERKGARDFIKWLDDSNYGFGVIKEKAKRIAPYDFQKSAIDKLLECALSGKTLLVEAPTASGKTEIPFASFLSQILERDFKIAPRLIYSLPLRSISNTMWSRAVAYLLALLVYSLRDVDEIKRFMRSNEWLVNGALRLPIGLETGSLVRRGDFLYGGFITIGTVDSIVYSYASQRAPGGMENPRLSLPSGLLATSLLVLDEVQMLQDEYYYSPRILNVILRQLSIVNSPMVVMTATMPTALKDKMLSGIEFEELVGGQSKRGRVFVDTSFFRQGKGLHDALQSNGVQKEIEKVIGEGKHALVVANRVVTAIETYKEIREKLGNKALLIHGRLNVDDRRKVEGKLEEGGYFVVATQVIESGYDFDAGLLVSEIAPPDSLLQRIGRVARKDTDRGISYIVDVKGNEPYTQSVMDSTKELLRREGGGRLEEAIHNMEETRQLLDEVYTKERVEELVEKKSLEFARSLYYLRKLRLFSLPPEDVEFAFRPEAYVTLVATNSDEVRDWIGRIENEKEAGLRISRNNFDRFMEVLEKNSLNVSEGYANRIKEAGLLRGKLVISHIYKEPLFKLRIDERRRVHPLEIWLLKPEAYETSLGVVGGSEQQ